MSGEADNVTGGPLPVGLAAGAGLHLTLDEGLEMVVLHPGAELVSGRE